VQVLGGQLSWRGPESPHPSSYLALHLFHLAIPELNLFIIASDIVVEKAMAPHSSTFAWEIPLTEEPGRLLSMGSRRVGYD